MPSRNAPVILVRFKENRISQTDFSKNRQVSNFLKIFPVGDELFHADGHAHMTKLTVTSRNPINTAQKKLADLLLASIKILQMG
jgi:hypothetical protein